MKRKRDLIADEYPMTMRTCVLDPFGRFLLQKGKLTTGLLFITWWTVTKGSLSSRQPTIPCVIRLGS